MTFFHETLPFDDHRLNHAFKKFDLPWRVQVLIIILYNDVDNRAAANLGNGSHDLLIKAQSIVCCSFKED